METLSHNLPVEAINLLVVVLILWVWRIDRAIAVMREQLTSIFKVLETPRRREHHIHGAD